MPKQEVKQEKQSNNFEENQQAVKDRFVKDRLRVIFSVFSTGENRYADINSLAHEGKIKFAAFKDPHFETGQNYRRGDSYLSPVIENPTWLDICILANDMILKTGDTHHKYLEDFKVHHVKVEGVAHGEFSMGS